MNTGTGGEIAQNALVASWLWFKNNATTIGVLLAVLYFLGKPHLEDFIDETVAGQFSDQGDQIQAVQQDVINLATEQRANTTELGNLKETVEEAIRLQKFNANVNQQILEAVQQPRQ